MCFDRLLPELALDPVRVQRRGDPDRLLQLRHLDLLRPHIPQHHRPPLAEARHGEALQGRRSQSDGMSVATVI